MGKIWALLTLAAFSGHTIIRAADDETAPPAYQLVISVAEQKLAVVKDGGLVCKYPVSTSKFGLGDGFNSYRTPLGRLKVCDKIGRDLPVGSVLKSRNATGEILPANAPGRDPIVTRIMWLEGLDAGNVNAKSRGIYIHGTVEESKLGQPVSYGCIRMRSRDVVELFDETPVGTSVEIISDKFPRFQKPAPPKTETLIAANDTVTTTTVGPRGMIIVRTVHNASAAPAKTTPAPAVEPVRLAANKPAPLAKPESTGSVEPPAKLAAKAATPPPIADGPTVVFTTGRLTAKRTAVPIPNAPTVSDEPRIMFSMSGSILTSDLTKKAAAPPPVAPTVSETVPAKVSGPRFLALDLGTISFSLAENDRVPAPPTDAFLQHLLNPPAPQLHLAFRSVAAKPGL